ncbi:hypothetical protein [Streptomyces canus]|uniref:peptidoglycan-binding domain-containing protein n=1 Tax=Streptomyces canus TaxID=58343 RepID=UPI002E2FE207|nr:hypothetical protein [Streptomyces canus]
MRQRRSVGLGAAFCAAATLCLVMPQVAAAAPEECSYISASLRPMLTYGDTGMAVKQAQCLSNKWAGQPPKLPLTGAFDSVMLKKIAWIQDCHGLAPSGVIEARTWQVLYHPALDCYDSYPV